MTLHRGKIARNIEISAIGQLTRDDLGLLEETRTVKDSHVQKLRDSHHALARLLALGMSQTEAADRSGYHFNRVNQLMRDPAFIQLVAEKRSLIDAKFAEVGDEYLTVLVRNMTVAERMISDKLEAADESGELPSTRELIAISRDAADRAGYGKKQTNLNVNIDFAANLEKARQRSGRTIEGRVERSPPLAPAPAQVDASPSRTAPLPEPTNTPFRRRA